MTGPVSGRVLPGRVLLVGGTGYLGGRLALRLAELGWQVAVAARTRNAWPAGLDAAFHPLDLPAPADALAPLLRGCRAVVNLAAANEIEAAADPARALAVTAGGAAALAEAAARAGVPRLLQLSTVHVYGRPAGRFDETRPPGPRHPYAQAHLAAEAAVLARRAPAGGGLDAAVLRLANVVGAPASARVTRWTLLGNDLCRQAAAGPLLRLRGDGLAWRSFLPLSALLAAVAGLLERPAPLPWACFHLGGPALRTGALAERIARLAGPAHRVERGAPDADPGEPFALDCGRLAALGCLAPLDLDPAILETLAFCRAVLP